MISIGFSISLKGNFLIEILPFAYARCQGATLFYLFLYNVYYEASIVFSLPLFPFLLSVPTCLIVFYCPWLKN